MNRLVPETAKLVCAAIELVAGERTGRRDERNPVARPKRARLDHK
jgi:hypothetical protein